MVPRALSQSLSLSLFILSLSFIEESFLFLSFIEEEKFSILSDQGRLKEGKKENGAGGDLSDGFPLFLSLSLSLPQGSI